jgi:sugar lactone lactonase YvrE
MLTGRFGVVLSALVFASALVAVPGAAAGATPVTTVVAFDPQQNEFPEGLAMTRRGDILVSMAFTGEVRHIDPAGRQRVLATIPPAPGLLLGLTSPRPGLLYAALASSVPETHGVWVVTESGQTRRIAALDPAGQPNGITTDCDGNGITTDCDGNIYVGDSLLGVVWRVTPSGTVQRWSEDPLLTPDPASGIGLGANGVLVHHGYVYVANTDRALVARIPIRADGTAGPARTYVADPRLLGADDLAFDVRGNLYVTTDGLGNSLVRATPAGRVATIADQSDGLDYAAGMKFGSGQRDRDTLFIANVGLNFGRPAVLAVDVGVPGLPG